VQPWSHYLNEISLATAGPPLSGAMEDCSIVRPSSWKCSIAVEGAVCRLYLKDYFMKFLKNMI